MARAIAVRLTGAATAAPAVGAGALADSTPASVATPGRLARWSEHRRAPIVVGLVVAVLVGIGAPMWATYAARTTADEPHYILSAISLWEDHDLDVSDERAAGRYLPFHEVVLPVQADIQPDGSQIEPHDPLLPVLLAVPVGVGGWLAGGTGEWLGAKLAMAAMAGVLAGLTMVVAMRRLGVSPLVAMLTALVAGLSPPLAIYGTQVYPELPAALALLAGFWWLTGPLSRRAVAGVVVATVALPWLSVKYAPLAAVLAVVLLVQLWRSPHRAWLGVTVGALAVSGVTYLAGHQWIYGGWTAYASGSHFAEGELTVVGQRPDYIGRSQRIVGLLVDRNFGLAIWQPAALALVPAMVVLWRRRPAGSRLLLGLLAVGWLMATYVALTMQGWWWPGRQTVVVIPMAVLAIAWWAQQLGSLGRRILLAAGLVGVAAYGFLLVGVLSRRHTLIVDFDRTLDPFVRIARVVLPNGQVHGPVTVTLLAAWTVGLASIGVWAWRSAARR